VAILSSVLRSKRAARVNVEIMRTFVQLRGILAAEAPLSQKVDGLEKKFDHQFQVVLKAIRELMSSEQRSGTET
jgi:hypothetical protein